MLAHYDPDAAAGSILDLKNAIISGGIFDFALYFFHNAKQLIANGRVVKSGRAYLGVRVATIVGGGESVQAVEELGLASRADRRIGRNRLPAIGLVRAAQDGETVDAGRERRLGLHSFDSGQRGRLLTQLAQKRLDRGAGPLDLDLDFAGGVAHPTGQPMTQRQPMDEGPEADPLDHPGHVEAQGGGRVAIHAGAVAIGGRAVLTATRQCGEGHAHHKDPAGEPVPHQLPLPSTASCRSCRGARRWSGVCAGMAWSEGLPEELRKAIQMREIEGMSYEDIAQAMDCPIGTVRSRIFVSSSL